MTMDTPAAFVFVGNHRALDFVNTEMASDGVPVDLLRGVTDLVGWLERSGSVDHGTATDAMAKWGGGRRGEKLVAAARALRTELRHVAEAAAEGRPVPRQALDRVNRILARGGAFVEVVTHPTQGFVERRGQRLRKPKDLLVPIAESAADLLCHADLKRVRRCAHPACVLYFLDGTKNGTRRWCDMRTCGNRANAAAYYRRRRREDPAPT
jgi:predicted RNA-binding Zn ribbon-like protein